MFDFLKKKKEESDEDKSFWEQKMKFTGVSFLELTKETDKARKTMKKNIDKIIDSLEKKTDDELSQLRQEIKDTRKRTEKHPQLIKNLMPNDKIGFSLTELERLFQEVDGEITRRKETKK
ncbi:hypothetical protein [Nitrosopumilus sp.]|uniref:hypothetical protein n=1 Tax=Nitrosopumilus sp. TaxID=2024843 RepID=UPI00247BF048|nr:hypothetical protein [Nitrosopumilus sp.]MCV0430700.1 hypothetical protein [Nitrosopumilus sp.]